VSKPEPELGQIIRFDYLWSDEARRGRTEGAKERPCAVIVARQRETDGRQRVLLAPITHSAPATGDPAIELLARFSDVTGLDDGRSWLVLSELNIVDWSDPGIVPAKPGTWLVGVLPKGIARRAVDMAAAIGRAGRLRTVKRD
jgi:hypothetical protein